MDHGRSDYNERIQDTAGRIPDDEPVFLLRGQDPFAARAVDYWIQMMIESLGGSSDFQMIADLQDHAERMRSWAREHAPDREFPDAPGSDRAKPRTRYMAHVTEQPPGQDKVEMYPMFDSEASRDQFVDEIARSPGYAIVVEKWAP
jgi:hypothetical protein